MHLCVHHFVVAAVNDGANFNFIFSVLMIMCFGSNNYDLNLHSVGFLLDFTLFISEGICLHCIFY